MQDEIQIFEIMKVSSFFRGKEELEGEEVLNCTRFLRLLSNFIFFISYLLNLPTPLPLLRKILAGSFCSLSRAGSFIEKKL